MRALKAISIIGLAFTLILYSFSPPVPDHFDTVIGEMQEGYPVITLDESEITDPWESVLATGGIEVELTRLEIIEIEEDVFQLIGSNSNDSIQAAISLVLDGSELYEEKHSGNGITVVCSTDHACAGMDKCQPVIRDGKGYCEPWCDPCNRTVTLTAGEPIIDVD